MKLFVEEEFQTVRAILKTGCSVARYGDGEIKLCQGKNQVAQDYVPALGDKLKLIITKEVPGLMICIPRVFGRHDLWNSDQKRMTFWCRVMNKPSTLDLLNKDKKYYSAFISRPDSAPHIDCEDYWRLVKAVWKDRDVAVLNGSAKSGAQNRTFFDTAKSVQHVLGPPRDAFPEYERLFDSMCEFSKDTMLLLELGPCATALAYDLHLAGYRVLDIGHMGAFYNKTHHKFKDRKMAPC